MIIHIHLKNKQKKSYELQQTNVYGKYLELVNIKRELKNSDNPDKKLRRCKEILLSDIDLICCEDKSQFNDDNYKKS